MSNGPLSDFETGDRPRHRQAEEIAADIGELERQIGELNSRREMLLIEHDEATSSPIPSIF